MMRIHTLVARHIFLKKLTNVCIPSVTSIKLKLLYDKGQ